MYYRGNNKLLARRGVANPIVFSFARYKIDM